MGVYGAVVLMGVYGAVVLMGVYGAIVLVESVLCKARLKLTTLLFGNTRAMRTAIVPLNSYHTFLLCAENCAGALCSTPPPPPPPSP
jgi:hypothetical protein